MIFLMNGKENSFDVDCIAGGPPCQGFSVAGKGISDDHRNTLIHDFLRVVINKAKNHYF